MISRPRFSIALLSEDSSEPTWRGLRTILAKLLRRYEDDGRTPRVEIVPSDPSVHSVLLSNNWRNTRGRFESERRELWRYLARKISEPGGFVVFHYDGDTAWSERSACTGLAQFEREIRTRVAQVLAAAKIPRDEIARRLRRLIECVPFYSVESWTYQATERAIAICRAKHRGLDVEKFQQWAADRARLDEVVRPKQETCLHGVHNEDLAPHVPVWQVAQTGRSMTWFLWCLHASTDLHDAIGGPPS